MKRKKLDKYEVLKSDDLLGPDYKSPIVTMYNDLIKIVEDKIMAAVEDVGVFVDKDTLIRALKYDRDSYNEGYEKGRKDGYKIGYKDGCDDSSWTEEMGR